MRPEIRHMLCKFQANREVKMCLDPTIIPYNSILERFKTLTKTESKLKPTDNENNVKKREFSTCHNANSQHLNSSVFPLCQNSTNVLTVRSALYKHYFLVLVYFYHTTSLVQWGSRHPLFFFFFFFWGGGGVVFFFSN